MFDTLQERMKNEKGGRILDVATQNGQFIHRLINAFESYREIIGIDTDDKSLIKAKELSYSEKWVDVGFLNMNSEKMDFVDECFDVVGISNSLHHIENLDQCLNEMKRVLRKGGYFIVAEMYSDVQRPSQKSHVLFHHWAAKIDMILGIYHEKTLEKVEIVKIFDDLQLESKEILKENDLTEIYLEEEILETFYTYIDKSLTRIEDHKLYNDLRVEGEIIKDYIRTNGWESAPQLIIIGRKT